MSLLRKARTTTNNQFIVNTITDGDQREPAVAVNQQGEIMIVWSSELQNVTGLVVLGRTFSIDGSALVSQDFRIATALERHVGLQKDWRGHAKIDFTLLQNNLSQITQTAKQEYDQRQTAYRKSTTASLPGLTLASGNDVEMAIIDENPLMSKASPRS